MKYELVKKLKDAGFPGIKEIPQKTGGLDVHILTLRFPDLIELIEACGESFNELVREHYPKGNIYWKAYLTEEAFDNSEDQKSYPCVLDCCGFECGDTPEEAVANLWLKINKK